jgi:hypothetical protein
MTSATLSTSSTSGRDDARALAILEASGVLNPSFTLDKLMDVSRQLAELESAADGGEETRYNVFIHRFYCLRHQPQTSRARNSA